MKTLGITPQHKKRLDLDGEVYIQASEYWGIKVDSAGFILGSGNTEKFQPGEQVKLMVVHSVRPLSDPRLTLSDLVEQLRAIAHRQRHAEGWQDAESDHIEADALLLEYIGSPIVTAAFEDIEKYYA